MIKQTILALGLLGIMGCNDTIGYGMRDREVGYDDGMEIDSFYEQEYVPQQYSKNFKKSKIRKAPFGYATFKNEYPMSNPSPEIFEEFLQESDVDRW